MLSLRWFVFIVNGALIIKLILALRKGIFCWCWVHMQIYVLNYFQRFDSNHFRSHQNLLQKWICRRHIGHIQSSISLRITRGKSIRFKHKTKNNTKTIFSFILVSMQTTLVEYSASSYITWARSFTMLHMK